MPQPLAVDREAVKAHAITHGVREAARAFNLSEDTVKQWSRRFGWLAAAGVATITQPLPASIAPRAVPNVPSASEAARNTEASLGEKTRTRFARGIARGALKVAHMKADTVLERAGEIKQLVDAGAKLHGWGQEGQSGAQAVLNIAFLAGAQPVEHRKEPVTTDVVQE